MFDIVDVLAVREAVERQAPLRRRICQMIMESYTKEEITRELGCSRFALWRHLRMIRRSFVAMGFGWPRRQKKREKNLPS